MQWILELLGFKSAIEKKKLKVKTLREKAFQAQRNGNLRLAGKYTLEAESLEEEIFEQESDEKL